MVLTSEKIKQNPRHRCARACASVHSHTCAYARTRTLEIVLHWWYAIEEATFHFRFNRENMRCCLTTPKILLELFCIRKIVPLYTSFWVLFIDSSKTDSGMIVFKLSQTACSFIGNAWELTFLGVLLLWVCSFVFEFHCSVLWITPGFQTGGA